MDNQSRLKSFNLNFILTCKKHIRWLSCLTNFFTKFLLLYLQV